MTENHHNDVIHMTSSCDVIENKNVENGRFEPFFLSFLVFSLVIITLYA